MDKSFMKDIRYFVTEAFYNIRNAHALAKSFWIGVISMVINNITFFVIWYLFMKTTGPINGWTNTDVFAMLGVSMLIFGIVNSFFRGIVDIPQFVVKGSFDSVLLSPVNTFLKVSGASFSVTAIGDLLMGLCITMYYAVTSNLNIYAIILFFIGIILGTITFLCVRLLCSLVVFFMYDGEAVSNQLFELFLRPGLYPGAIFPTKLRIFFMTAVPALLTSAVPIDIVKQQSTLLVLTSLVITSVWLFITYTVFRLAIRRYESGNMLR
jgi:ABC-2 type transport system permease protein